MLTDSVEFSSFSKLDDAQMVTDSVESLKVTKLNTDRFRRISQVQEIRGCSDADRFR